MPKGKFPLISYLNVEKTGTAEIERILRRSLRDVDAQLKATFGDNIGDVVKKEQLEAQRAALKAQLDQDWSKVGAAIDKGQQDAAAAASKVVSSYEEALARTVLDGQTFKDLVDLEAQRAAATVRTLMDRKSSSYIPLAQTVYNSNVKLQGQIDNLVNSALLRGLSARDFAKEVRDFINPATPGGASYAAKRLARTEINNAFHATANRRYANSLMVDAVEWHKSTSHPENDECDTLEEESPYPKTKVPRKPHPQCLCYTVPALKDNKKFMDDLLAQARNKQKVLAPLGTGRGQTQGWLQMAWQWMKQNQGLMETINSTGNRTSPLRMGMLNLLTEDPFDRAWQGAMARQMRASTLASPGLFSNLARQGGMRMALDPITARWRLVDAAGAMPSTVRYSRTFSRPTFWPEDPTLVSGLTNRWDVVAKTLPARHAVPEDAYKDLVIEHSTNLPYDVGAEYNGWGVIYVDARHPQWDYNLELFHELGHYADQRLIGESGVYTSATDAAFADVFRANPAFAKIGQALKDGDIDQDFYDYLTMPEEVFGRAYSQWMMTEKYGDDFYTAGRFQTESSIGMLWTKEEFKPISAALDKMFQSSGLPKAADVPFAPMFLESRSPLFRPSFDTLMKQTPSQYTQEFIDLFDGPTFGKNGYRIVPGSIYTDKEEMGYPNIHFGFTIRDANGEKVGNGVRTFKKENGEWSVYHDLLKLDESARGGGFATEFNNFMEDWYVQNGVKEIKLHAALENGAYTWARAGYTWDPRYYEGGEFPGLIAERVRSTLTDYSDAFPDVTDEELVIMQHIIEAYNDQIPFEEWPSPADIANMNTKAVKFGHQSLGHWLLDGLDWHGVKRPTPMTRHSLNAPGVE